LSTSTPSAKARRYRSPVRERQAEETRQRILEALAGQLGRPDTLDVNVTEAAKEAGVSVRTVYHYFPDRAARVEALAEWTREALGPVDHPLDTADDIPGFTRAAYARAELQEAFWRIGMVPGLSSDVRRARHGRVRLRIRELLGEIGASGPETERATAAILLLESPEGGVVLVDMLELSFVDAADAAAEAIAAVITQLRAVAGDNNSP
jgi:AcrR family transcriptional regulator